MIPNHLTQTTSSLPVDKTEEVRGMICRVDRRGLSFQANIGLATEWFVNGPMGAGIQLTYCVLESSRDGSRSWALVFVVA
jgi:hypothetical protein